MSVSVVVPWRGGCPHRERAWAWLRRWWARTHPAWQVVEGHCPDGPWRKAVAVADGLTRATGTTLVIADADVWCDGIAAAVDAVHSGAPWAVPHRLVHRLTEPATAAVLAGADPCGQPVGQPPYEGYEGGGIVVLPRATYERIPLDPRFAGWGGEDGSFGRALALLAGRRFRGDAPLFHAWHPPQERLNRHVGSAASRALEVRYQYAAKAGRRAMAALLDEIRRTPATELAGGEPRWPVQPSPAP